MKKHNILLFYLLATLLCAASASAADEDQDYDNTGATLSRLKDSKDPSKTIWNTATEGMDCILSSDKYYVLSMQAYGYANLFTYDGSSLKEYKHFKLGSFHDKAGTIKDKDYQNHCNQVNFGNTKWASTDALPLAYFSRCNIGTADSWGYKTVCYVEHIPISQVNKDTPSALVQVISMDNLNKYKGNTSFMVDGNYLYAFQNTIGNGKPGNRHHIYKFKLPAPPVKSDGYKNDNDSKLPVKTELTADDLIYQYDWEDYYIGGANHSIQGGKVKDGLMYLPWGKNSDNDPSIIYVWNLDKRRMEMEINLQGTASNKGTVKFSGELEDVSFGYPGRMLVQAHIPNNPGKLYWISTDYLDKLRQNDWCADVKPDAPKYGNYKQHTDGYYYLKTLSNSGDPAWVNVAEQTTKLSTKQSGFDGIVGQHTLHWTNAASVPGSGHDPSYMFHLVAPAAKTDSVYSIQSCAVTGTPYVQQYKQSKNWSVMNTAATAPSSNYSKFIMVRGNTDESVFIKPYIYHNGEGINTRMWRRGGAVNGITTSTLREYNDNLNDFVWVPITDAQVLGYAKYCEQVSICLGLPKGTDEDQVRTANYDEFQAWLKAQNTTYDANADYAALLNQVLEKKDWATGNVAPDGAFVQGTLRNGQFTASSNGLWYYRFDKDRGDFHKGDYVIVLDYNDGQSGRPFKDTQLIKYLVDKGCVYYADNFINTSTTTLSLGNKVTDGDLITASGATQGYVTAVGGKRAVIPYKYINPADPACITTIDLSQEGTYKASGKTHRVNGEDIPLYNFTASHKLSDVFSDKATGIEYFAPQIKQLIIDRSHFGNHNAATSNVLTDGDGSVTGTVGAKYQIGTFSAESNLDAQGKTTDGHLDALLQRLPALENLNLKFNNLATLDVSKNTALKSINLDDNQLTSLDVTHNPELQTLYVAHNFDFMTLKASRNENMRDLRIFDTMYGYDPNSTADGHINGAKFNTEVLANFPNLEILYCYANYFDQLDVTSLPHLKSLWALKSNHQADRVSNKGPWLHTLDLSNNTELCELVLDGNHLPGLRVASTHLGEGYDVQTDYTHTRTVACNATPTPQQAAEGYGQTRVTMTNNYRTIKADMAKWSGKDQNELQHWHYLYFLRLTNELEPGTANYETARSHLVSQKQGWYTISNYSDYTNDDTFTRTRTEVGNEERQTLPVNYDEVPGGMTMGYFSGAADAWITATWTESLRNGQPCTELRTHADGSQNLEVRKKDPHETLHGQVVVLKEYDIVQNDQPVGNPVDWTGQGGAAPMAVGYLWNISSEPSAPIQGEAAPRKVAVTNPDLYWQRFYFDLVYPDFNAIATGIDDLTADDAAKTVQRVTWYDLQGRIIGQPMTGVNIKVTTYDDGSQKTEKVIKN